MASIQVPCQNCGTILEMGVGQHLEGKRLYWSAGYKCPICDYQFEMDEQGEAPPNIRQAILEATGAWGLAVPETVNGAKALMTLRSALDLSIADVSELRKRIPGIVVSGTHLEMKRVQAFLSELGVKSSIHRQNR